MSKFLYSKHIKYLKYITILICSIIVVWYRLEIYYKINKKHIVIVFSGSKHEELKPQKKLACKIPHLNPHNQQYSNYFEKPKPITCGGKHRLVDSNETHLIVNVEHISDWKVSLKELNCFYKAFWRVNPPRYQRDNIVKYYNKYYPFKTSAKIPYEFVLVNCYNNTSKIYTDFHSFVPFKQKFHRKPEEKLNVMILGLDGISRLNFQRTMPSTWKFLMEELVALEFVGYNKVGENTFPNLVPLLMGLSEMNLNKTCWVERQEHFDDCPFVWKKFNESGYVTGYGEDSYDMATFTYQKNGFKSQPTTHYWHTFNAVMEELIGYNKLLNSKICAGTKRVYELLLEYSLKFIKTYKTHKFFGFFWQNSLSHDFINFPTLGDEYYKDYLHKLENTGVLNNTILFFLSDHGYRWLPFRSTHQGHIESNMPLLYVVLPKWFRGAHPVAWKNLQENAEKLTTAFDLHETLLDVVNNNFDNNRLEIKRGMSLFRPIPDNRTCKMANIQAHWCACYETRCVNITSVVVKAVKFCLKQIRMIYEKHAGCLALEVAEIRSASYFKAEDFEKKFETVVNYYVVSFKTEPGGGEFEATVRCVNCANDFELSGEISRTNLYGNQSFCVDGVKVKPFCYCKQLTRTI